ncbi:MAG: VOC family protein [Myxococcota bacterium]
MSRLFGPIVQLGYVLPDVEKMMADYLAAGIGPFFLMAPRPLVSYYGEQRNDVVISGAFSFCGDQQIELLCQDNDAPSVYRDFLRQSPGGGLHHVAMWADDVWAKLEDVNTPDRRFEVVQQNVLGPDPERRNEIYLAPVGSADSPSLTIQIMEPTEETLNFFAFMKEAAEGWDGSEPIREMPG